MKSLLLSSMILTCALASTASAGALASGELTPAERAALSAQPAAELVAQRAGEEAGVPPVAAAERSQLSRAQASAQDLDALRAGDVSDHDLVIVAVIVAIVALIIAA